MAVTLKSIAKGKRLKPPKVVLYGVGGMGKALANGEPVLTPSGFVPIESLVVGDSVCTPSGRVALVSGVYPQGKKECARVTTTLGGEVIASMDHLWVTRDSRGIEGVRTTKAISDTLMYGKNRNHALPLVAAQELDDGWRELDVQPYTLGAWIGDGSKDSPVITCPDGEVFESVCSESPGMVVRHRENRGRCRSILVTTKVGSGGAAANPFIEGLRTLGLWGLGSHERFIPEKYLFASVADRISILTGLMDTDGYVSGLGTVQYTTTSQRLASDVQFLVQSVGGSAKISSRIGSYRKGVSIVKCRRAYTLTMSLPDGIIPLTVERKRSRVKDTEDRYRRHFISSVEHVGIRNCTCIAVDDPDRMFITRSFMPTHNTTFAASAPNPIFLCTEEGQGALDIARFEPRDGDPIIESWPELLECVGALYNEEHDYQTVVIDTLDFAEPLLHKHTAKEHGKKDIEAFGYGKGYTYALDEARILLAGLDALRNDRGMVIVLLAHCEVKKFDSPDSDSFDRWKLRLRDNFAALVHDWSDALLFINYRSRIVKEDAGFNKERSRAVGHGERVIYTEARPAWQAKNRYALPPELIITNVERPWLVLQNAIAEAHSADVTQEDNNG